MHYVRWRQLKCIVHGQPCCFVLESAWPRGSTQSRVGWTFGAWFTTALPPCDLFLLQYILGDILRKAPPPPGAQRHLLPTTNTQAGPVKPLTSPQWERKLLPQQALNSIPLSSFWVYCHPPPHHQSSSSLQNLGLWDVLMSPCSICYLHCSALNSNCCSSCMFSWIQQ